MHRDLGALQFHVLELWRLRPVAYVHLHLIVADGVLHVAQVLAQITAGHIPDNQGCAIVSIVDRVPQGVFLGQLNGFAILDEEAPGNGIGAIVAVHFRRAAFLCVDMMPVGGYLGAVLDVDGDHSMRGIVAAVISQALIHAGINIVDTVQDDDSFFFITWGRLYANTLKWDLKYDSLIDADSVG